MSELAAAEDELPQIAAELDDAELTTFARQVYQEEAQQRLGLAVRDWNGVLGALRAEVERRPDLAPLTVELGYYHACSHMANLRFEEAQALLAATLARAEPGNDRRGWILATQAQIAGLEERWTTCLERLDQAAAEAERTRDPAAFGPWIDGLRARTWIYIGMPELAGGWVDRQWRAAQESRTPETRLAALDVRIEALKAANDYAGLAEFETELRRDDWLSGLGPAARARLELKFAHAQVEQGLADPALNATARARLAALLAANELTPADRDVARFAQALACLDAGELDAAGEPLRELRASLTGSASLDPARAQNTMAPWLLALEAELLRRRARQAPIEPAELAQALDDMRATWRAVRARWSEAPTRNGGLGYLFLSNRQLLVQSLLGLEELAGGPERGAERVLEWLIEAQLESTLARRMGIEQAPVEAVRTELLSETRGLIAWIPLRNRSLVLACDRGRTRTFELSDVGELERLAGLTVGELQRAVAEPERVNEAELAALLARAGVAFLPPDLVQFLAPWDSFYAVGLDDIGYVPLELFETPAGTTIGAGRAICRLPSIPVALQLARSAEGGGVARRARLLIADRPAAESAARDGLEPLAIETAARRRFRAALGEIEIEVLEGDAAELSALQLAQPAPGLFHIVAHGTRRADERPPGIVLADGAAFAEDVEAVPSAPCVLLSVCGSARSSLRRGDGGRGDLSSSFLLAGSLAVVSSPSDLGLEPTLEVGTALHERLSQGDSLAAALTHVRRAALEEHGRFAPQSLAAHLLHATGVGWDVRFAPAASPVRPPDAAPARELPTVALALLALVVAGALFVWRRSRAPSK